MRLKLSLVQVVTVRGQFCPLSTAYVAIAPRERQKLLKFNAAHARPGLPMCRLRWSAVSVVTVLSSTRSNRPSLLPLSFPRYFVFQGAGFVLPVSRLSNLTELWEGDMMPPVPRFMFCGTPEFSPPPCGLFCVSTGGRRYNRGIRAESSGNPRS